MIRNISLWLSIIIVSLSLYSQTEGAVDSAPKDETKMKFSGTPRLVRDYPSPMVYFQEGNVSYGIPTNSNYNKIMNDLNSGLKRKTKVNLIVNNKTRNIVDLDKPLAPDPVMFEEEDPIENLKDKKEGASSGKETQSKSENK